MKVLLLLTVVGAVFFYPFVWLKRPWAVRLWQRFKLFLAIYVFVIVLAAVLRLAFGWGDIYG